MATRAAVFLRGINVGRAKRVAMADLAEVVRGTGAEEVRTLLNSGNVVCTTTLAERELAAQVHEGLVAVTGVDVDVVARTRKEIDAIVALDPLGHVATDPSRYLVVLLDKAPSVGARDKLAALDVGPDVWELHGRELHLWMPPGVADSLTAKALAKGVLGVTWTGRNRATMLKVQAAM